MRKTKRSVSALNGHIRHTDFISISTGAARKGIFFSQQLLLPGCKVYITDAAVPLSRLPELVDFAAKDIKDSGFIAPILGHSGDGNVRFSA